VLFLIQVVADLLGQLLGEFAEPNGRGVDATKLVNECLDLVVIRQRVTSDAESGVVHQERHVEVALLSSRVSVELAGQRQKRGATVVG